MSSQAHSLNFTVQDIYVLLLHSLAQLSVSIHINHIPYSASIQYRIYSDTPNPTVPQYSTGYICAASSLSGTALCFYTYQSHSQRHPKPYSASIQYRIYMCCFFTLWHSSLFLYISITFPATPQTLQCLNIVHLCSFSVTFPFVHC